MNTTVIRLNSIALPPPPQTAFWRYVWKELRTLRSFWLAVAGLAIAGLWLTTQLADRRADLPSILLMAAMGAGVTYAVGAAATLFAVEHEEGTYGFLSVLPSSWSPMFWGKLFAAGSSSISLTIVLGLVVLPLAGQWPEQTQALEVVGQLGLAVPEVLVWGTLFSLLLKRPLIAALLTIVAEFMAVHLIVNVIPSLIIPDWYLRSELYTAPFRFGMILLVLMVDLWLVRRWWPTDRRASNGHDGFIDTSAVLTQTHWYAFSSSSRFRMLGRLAWQTWRQSWSMMSGMLVLVFCFQFLLIRILFGSIQGLAEWNPSLQIVSLALNLISPAIYFSAVLHADHRRQSHSFLAGHAVSGTWVWFSRLLVWTVVYTIPMVIVPALFGWWNSGSSFSMVLAMMYFSFAYNIFIGLAIGQFCALMIRQSLVAAFLSVLLSCLYAVWMQIVVAWELPLLSFLYPVPFGLLLAAWFRAPDWISQRNGLRSWSKVALAIVLPIGLVVARVPHARLSPVLESMNVFQDVRPTEGIKLNKARKSGDQLLQLGRSIAAINLGVNPTDQSDSANRQEPLESIIEICQRPTVRFPDLAGPTNRLEIAVGSDLEVLTKVMSRLAAAGKQACEQNNFDLALENYLAWWRLYGFVRSGQSVLVNLRVGDVQPSFSEHMLLWSQHKSQSVSQIKEAIRQLDLMPPWTLSTSSDSSYFPPNPQENIWADHDCLQAVLEERRDPRDLHVPTQRLALLMNKFSFERQRSVRILTALTCERTKSMRQVLEHINCVLTDNSHPLSELSALSTSNTYQAEQLRLAVQQTYHMEKKYTVPSKFQQTHVLESQLSYPIGHWLRTSYLLKNEYLPIAQDEVAFIRQLVDSMVRHLGLKTQLALIAYRIDHDKYPKTLDALTPEYLPQVVIDPYSGQPFEYRPAGIHEQLKYGSRQPIAIQPDTPFFWSVGASNFTLEQHVEHLGEIGDYGGYGGMDYGVEGGFGGEGYSSEVDMDYGETWNDANAQGIDTDNLAELEAVDDFTIAKQAAKPSKTRTVYKFISQEGSLGPVAPIVFQLPKSIAPQQP